MEDLKPGVELNALIAEKVFGFNRERNEKLGLESVFYLGDDFHPPYSTDISAAWEVVEKFKDEDLRITWCEGVREWLVEFTNNQAVADGVLSHAICLAALKAVDD